MNDHTASTRGHQAEREWAEVSAAFAEVRNGILSALQDTPVGSDAKIIKLHMALQNLSAVEVAIREVIDNGKVARAALSTSRLTQA